MFKGVNDRTFVETIDYIIINSEDNVKMKDAISRLDNLSKKKGVTIYQTIYELFQRDVIEERAIQWINFMTSNNSDRSLF
jgi:hypothetical protein